MKKKVALLLALVMAFSVLPMNVFGAVGAVSGVTGGLTAENLDSPAPISITVPYGALYQQGVPATAGGGYAYRVVVEFTGAFVSNEDVAAGLTNTWQALFGEYTWIAGTPGASNVLPTWDGNAGYQRLGEGAFILPTTTGSAIGSADTRSMIDGMTAGYGTMAVLKATEHNGDNQSTAFIDIVTDFLIPSSSYPGSVTFTLPVRGWAGSWSDSSVSVGRAPGWPNIVSPVNLATTDTARVTWSANARGFDSALHVPPITLSESRFGVIEGVSDITQAPSGIVPSRMDNRAIRITAPSFYTWSFGLPDGMQYPAGVIANRSGLNNILRIVPGGVADGRSFNNVANNSLPIDAVFARRVDGSTNAAARHEIIIVLSDISRNPNFSGGLGAISVENLWLIPDDHAQPTGSVSVKVEYGTWGNTPAGGGTAPNSFTAVVRRYAAPGLPSGRLLPDGQVTDLVVGNRGAAGLRAEADGSQVIRTGSLGEWRGLNARDNDGMRYRDGRDYGANDNWTDPAQAWLWNRDNDGVAHWTGIQTSTIIIEETIAGGFTVGYGSPINFEFLDENGNPDPGIRILGMEARAGNERADWKWNRGELNGFYRGSLGVFSGNNDVAWPWNQLNQNWMTFSGWLSALRELVPAVSSVGRISDTMATVYLPSQTITDVPNPGILEVRLYLSVEAGYAVKNNPGNYEAPINVTISGAGVVNLPESERTIQVATAQDPIYVTHTDPVQLETGTLYNVLGYQQLSNVTIDVVNNQAFDIGDEIWLYVATDVVGRNFDLNIATIPTVTVTNPESGLRLDSGRLGNPQLSLGTNRDVIVFTVTRMPFGGDAPAPIIEVSNLFVEGQAWPGIEYHLIVSGTSVAQNDQEVYYRRYGVASSAGFLGGEAADIARANRGIFTTLPYKLVTLENVAGGPYEGPSGDESQVGTRGRVSFTIGSMVDVDGVAIQAIIFEEVAPGIVSTMINPRVFADYIGASVDWDPDARTATFTGSDAFGNETTVVLTQNSPNITVNGESYDIGVRAGQPMLEGLVYPVTSPAERIYVPARVLADIFNVPIEFNAGTVTLG